MIPIPLVLLKNLYKKSKNHQEMYFHKINLEFQELHPAKIRSLQMVKA